MNKIAWVHLDIINRSSDFENNLYPKSHLWGYPLGNNDGINELNPFIKKKGLIRICNLYERITRSRFGNLVVEISLLIKIKQFNSIYCISGKLFWIPILKKIGLIRTKLIILIYRIPEKSPFWKFHNLHLSTFLLSAFDGINCLTQKTANDLISILSVNNQIKYIPWCTDEKFFFNKNTSDSKYFFSSGKTNRDYTTLIKSIKQLPDKKFLLIGHFPEKEPIKSLNNLTIINSADNQTDTAITYECLKKHYSESIAVCIPLHGDPNDTCGFTEMLEAMSMGKAILMTRSGCLDIDIEKNEIGYYVNPKDPLDWVKKINYLANNPQKAKLMGQNGRKLIKEVYNVTSYEKRTQNFLNKISQQS